MRHNIILYRRIDYDRRATNTYKAGMPTNLEQVQRRETELDKPIRKPAENADIEL